MNKKKTIISVVGARPNFMKLAPIARALKKQRTVEHVIVHTGQHYDAKMSTVFFKELGIRQPDIDLGVKEKTHGAQTGEIMKRFETVCLKRKPDVVIVVGDVNSTAACALVAAKLNIKVAHVEAGLRSFDRTMPEEINRVVTDSIADYLFVTEKSAIANLLKEGHDKKKIHFVGNTMIDTLVAQKQKIIKSDILKAYCVQPKTYCVLTLHRPSNVDNKKTLEQIMNAIQKGAQGKTIIFPVHPRTRKNLPQTNGFTFIAPLGYHDFMALVRSSAVVITDSGGIQEEASFLGVPCVTIRNNTERPVTITQGTNILAGTDPRKIIVAIQKALKQKRKKIAIPRWDGKASDRIVGIITKVVKT